MDTTKKGPTAGTVKGPDNQSELFYRNAADLSSEAAEITRLHTLAQRHAKAAIDTAIEIGGRLAAVKKSLLHGEWIPWIENNLPFGRKQAFKYMQIFEGREKMLSNVSSGGHLSINEAVKLLSTPKAPALMIDPEFSSILPPLRDCEYNMLEENLITYGCRNPLVVWRGILLDGHARYELCRKHNIAFEVVEVDLPGRKAAVEWIISNQCQRKNLTEAEYAIIEARIRARGAAQ